MSRSITGSVGVNGANRYDDVSIIQELLNNVSDLFPGTEGGPDPKIDVDGFDGAETRAAIKQFQLHHFGKADSRVDPAQKTLEKLNGFDLLNVKTPVEAAEAVKDLALLWVSNALLAIDGFLAAGAPVSADSTAAQALRKHFHIDRLSTPVVPFVQRIRRNFGSIQTTLTFSKRAFRNLGDKKARRFDREANPGKAEGDLFAAWTVFQQFMGFTSEFKRRGPNCQRAMIVHEAAHYVDIRVGDQAGEWDEPNYSNLMPELAANNASCYPTFAVHVTTGSDEPASRFGEGNPGI